MNPRAKVVVAVLLVLAGAGLWVFVARPLLGPTGAQWDAQVRQDALTLTQLLRYDFRVEGTAAIDAAWEKRRPLYDADHLADLGERLLSFVDFQVAEYADAKDVYLSGRDPAKPSTQALVAQEKLRGAFGAEADEMVRQFRDRVREEAYKASPKVGGGVDPAAPRWDGVYDDLVRTWLPQARATVARLTSPPR